ncbi:hypothetical protein AMAG_17603 [Allomyces macrogynus ATCC 38327]|uniref:Retrovirus-related Pol polyprotein from transposon TNT 1-94-like beta-barrel domain-containing protein n=1 Tax=Allomyces macrogynus (strain ATCC 38327) TaxID=578462 RepID=A0A0L0RVB3_ALLM3|nr:hypothetical protein AMAG_17603 [Allomyces macrogynus ATCC 38327]|eukprot:KNE54005.1 hypothetical protein AMAG_17603 [Allomyces macrogynus ATCC 38327]
MTVTMTLSVSVKTPISGQPAMIEMLKADGSNWPMFADRFLGFLTADQLEDLLELKSFKVLVDADFEVVSLEQQEEMTDAQFKKLIELDLDVKFVADAIYWNGLVAAERKKCMAHNSYKAKSCIWSIIKVVLPSAVVSELLLVFLDATCGMATPPGMYPPIIHSPKVDLATGAHFCGNKSLFATLNDMRPGKGFLVSLGDHCVCHPIGKGTMCICTPSGNIVHLDLVWYIPGFKMLVSVSELYDRTAMQVIFGDRDIQFVHCETGDLLATGVWHGGYVDRPRRV